MLIISHSYQVTSMANSFFSLPIFSLFLLLLFFNSGGIKPANGQAPGQGSWCIPKPSTCDEALRQNIKDACSIVNCTAIKKGGPCFYPTTLMSHASVAMNLYYQNQGRHYTNCDFKNTAVIVVTDPSYDCCIFEYAVYD